MISSQRGGGWQSHSGLVSEAAAAALSNLASATVAIDGGKWLSKALQSSGNKFGIYYESDLGEIAHNAIGSRTSFGSKPCLAGEAG